MSATLEYLEATRGLYYPFVNAATDGRVNDLFADIRAVRPASQGVNGPAVMTTLTLSGAGLRFILSDDAGEIIDTDTATSSDIAILPNWRIHQYVNAAGVRAVVAINRETYDEVVAGTPISNLQDDLELIGWCVDNDCRKVLSLNGLIGAITLNAGYNIKVTPTGNSLKLDAVAGSGAGRVPVDCEDDNSQLRTINGVGPVEAGGFQLNATGCHWLETMPTLNSLELNNDCDVCLDCDSLISAYEALSRVRDDAAALRARLCQAIIVYNDYVSLLNRFAESFNENKLTLSVTQTDFEAFAMSFALQVGELAIKEVEVTVSYGPAEVTSEFHQYSFREKVPGFAPRQKIKDTTTPASPDTGSTFDGTFFHYDASASPTDTALVPNRFAQWYWNMHFERDDGATQVDITWSATITFIDNTTASYGPTTESVDIVPQNSV